MDDANSQILIDIKWVVKRILKQNQYYSICYNYFNGNQPLAFATERFRKVFGTQFEAFAANLCPVVVNTVVDRLVISGFTQTNNATVISTEQVDPKAQILETRLMAMWDDNMMQRVEAEIYQDSFTCGDGYLFVWPDDSNQPELTSQDPLQICVRYDPENRYKIIFAGKLWRNDENFIRLNLYYPDRILKFITPKKIESSANLEQLGNDASFIPFIDSDGVSEVTNDYGIVPIFHFPNAARIGSFGRSELADVMPLQDAVNKALMDMLVAQEFAAFPQRWATGVEFEIDKETDQPINPFKSGVERVWTLTDNSGKFGEFAAADLTKFLDVREGFVKDMARISQTPLHYFSGASHSDRYPSGEALRTAESPLISKLHRKQNAFGTVWAQVTAFCLLIMGEDPVKVKPLWKGVEAKNYLVFWEGLEILKRLGVSGRQVLREGGYSDAQIEAMHTENMTDFVYEQKISPQTNLGVNVYDQAKTISTPNQKA